MEIVWWSLFSHHYSVLQYIILYWNRNIYGIIGVRFAVACAIIKVERYRHCFRLVWPRCWLVNNRWTSQYLLPSLCEFCRQGDSDAYCNWVPPPCREGDSKVWNRYNSYSNSLVVKEKSRKPQWVRIRSLTNRITVHDKVVQPSR